MRPSFHSSKSSQAGLKLLGIGSFSCDEFLDRVADLATLAVIFITPLFMGGRHDLGRLAYVSAVTVLTCSWLAKQYLDSEAVWWKVRGGWLLVAGLAVVVCQLIPMAPETLGKLAPAQRGLLPLWQSHDGQAPLIAEWRQLSLTPRHTKLGLIVYWAHISLFFVSVQRLTDLARIERLLRWIALGALSMAAFGFVQYLSGTEKFAWCFRHPSRDAHWYVCGPFANSNHFAHFLALGIGPLIWWLRSLSVNKEVGPTGNRFYNNNHRERELFARLMILLAMGVLGLSGILSLSRGGMLVMATASFIAIGLFVLTGLIGRRVLFGLGAVCALVAASLFLHGTGDVSDELGTLTAGSVDQLDETHGRRRIWAANWQAAQTFPVLGAGVGSHAEIYPKFFPHRSRVEFTHAESSYLNLLTETGFIGLAIAVLSVLMCCRWCWKIIRSANSLRAGTCGIAVTASIAVSALHSVWDFVWYIGGCMSLTALIVACACRLAGDHVRGSEDTPRQYRVSARRWFLSGVAVTTLFAGFLCIQWGPALAAPHWNQYLRLSLGARGKLNEVYADKGAGPNLQTDERHYDELRRMYDSLSLVLRHDPTHYRAQLRAASVLIKSFDLLQKKSANAMGYVQIRDAVWASDFRTVGDQNRWLDVAVGDNIQVLRMALEHALAGLRGCPLQGRGYINWADLAFLRGSQPALTKVLLAQAQLVRPHDGAVLFNLGREAALAGNAPEALEFWKAAFRLDARYRNAVIQALAPRLPATAFVQHFQPNAEETEALFHFYRVRNAITEARTIAPMLGSYLTKLASTQQGTEAMRTWLKCVDVYRCVDNGSGAVEAAQQAVKANPNDFDARLALAHQLTKEQRLAEAEEHWYWCARRHPHDKALVRQLERLQALQLSAAQQSVNQRSAPQQATSPQTAAQQTTAQQSSAQLSSAQLPAAGDEPVQR